MSELDGKVAIVTGAGRLRGIGRAAAVRLAELGADVIVTGTGRDPFSFPDDEKAVGWRDIESTADQIRALGRRALPVVANVADEAQVQALIDRTMAEFGRVDILINNAASAIGADRSPIVDVPLDVFQWVLDVKVTGTYLCTRAFLKAGPGKGEGGRARPRTEAEEAKP